MPIYEFKCSRCGHVFEFLHLSRDEEYARCPVCGEVKTEKLLSTFSSFSSSQSQGAGSITSSSSCGSSGGFS